jgi:DNA-binding winged helix-turn-helix (wHTH) protein
MPPGRGFRFGPYRLDLRGRSLFRDGIPIPIRARQFDVLHVLVRNAGELVTKDDLVREAWRGVIVDDSAVTQAVSRLRHLPGAPDFESYVVTMPGHGYRFIEVVTPDVETRSRADLLTLLAPDRAWADGLAALESFDPDLLRVARTELRQLVAASPREVRFRIVLALVCALIFDSTRIDTQPDVEALREAETEAYEACGLSPDLAECWATLGFVLERTGDRANALDAHRRACRLEPANYLHHGRLAGASWGQARLRAVRDTLRLNPGFAIAHFFGAEVWIARRAFDDARSEVEAGVAAMEAEAMAPAPFRAVGLYLLRGLLFAASGTMTETHAAWDREIALSSGHLYGRECRANAWSAKGACYLKAADDESARDAFGEALALVSGHTQARAGLAILDGPGGEMARGLVNDSCTAFELVTARAAVLAHTGDVAAAVAMVHDALRVTPPGNAGWQIPVDPLLRVWERPDAWEPVLALLHARAR